MTEIPLPYKRALRLGSFGYDVWGLKRATYRFLDDGKKWTGFVNQTPVSKKTFGPFFKRDFVEAQDRLFESMGTGVLDEKTLRALEHAEAFDDTAARIWRMQYEQHETPAPALIEPRQGFDSLVRDLWEAYSIGRRMGLTDLGTYNPASRLPSGHASDHATSRRDGRIGQPACAFDLGFTPAIGTANLMANKFFHLMIGRPELEYAICGNSIWSVEKGMHRYTYGGHSGHVHVSGHRR